MFKINRMVLISLNIILLFLLSACFSKKDVEQPVKDYFKKEYGIKDGVQILSTDNNWFEGIDHQTYVEIEKPYYTTVYLMIKRDSFVIDERDSDDAFLEIFKGAYVEQHQNVIKQSEKMIKKYNLMSESPWEYDVGKQNFYYYLTINMDEKQEKDLRKRFKTTQTLHTKEIISRLNRNESESNSSLLGVVNITFLYNTYKNRTEIPNAQSIVDDFKDSHVLTEGIYNIAVNTIEASDNEISQSYEDERNTNVLFRVDELGGFKVIEPLK